jgi:hypothetical protein
METYLIFTLLTTISFILLLLTNQLRKQAKKKQDRLLKVKLEILSTIAFAVSLISLVGNWAQVAHHKGYIKLSLFN